MSAVVNMRTTIGRLAALLALFAAGALLAGLLATGGFALDTTTETLTETATTVETTTEQVTTATVEQTTVREVTRPAATTPATTAEGSDGGGTPTWVWVLVGVLAAATVVLAAVLLTRRGSGVSAEERSRRLDAAVRSWAAQGYALESQSADSAVVRRGGERVRISVDATGGVASEALATNDWPGST
jgi:hypothetical protein